MYNDIRLFIDGRQVEFSDPPQILYNYNVTDFTNPTIVQNSFSKTITVHGTPTNNDIFGHIWRLDRVQTDEGGGGTAFNPIRRAPFELFVNGEKYESGYVRLNNIKREGNHIEYEIMLFGGIGSLFYNLSYAGEDSNDKLTLADLPSFKDLDSAGPEPDLDFIINKEAVSGAWNTLRGEIDLPSYDEKWKVINFAVTSEGIPEDFDASKALVNLMSATTRDFSGVSGDYKAYINGSLSGSGYVLGEANQELTVDNTFDLRSYLLRPVLNVKRTIDAIRNPDANGGYEIALDEHFFNGDNPYYDDAWMTLPMLRDLDIERKESTTITTGNISKTDTNHFSVTYTAPSMGGKVTSTDFSVNLLCTVNSSANYLYMRRKLTTNKTPTLFGSCSMENNSQSVIFLQAFAYNAAGDVIAKSKPFLCSESPDAPYPWQRSLAGLYSRNEASTFVKGKFKKSGSTYVYVDDNDDVVDFNFNLKVGTYSRIEVYLEMAYSYYNLQNSLIQNHREQIREQKNSSSIPLWTGRTMYTTNCLGFPQANTYGSVTGTFNLGLEDFVANMDSNSNIFTGTKIPKDKLLATPFSPADFLLSYCKLFGLYFYRDPLEASSNPNKFPNGVVHIVDRDTFYTDEWVNINNLIDRGKPMTITPVVAESKWYEFGLEEIGSEAQEKYKSTYGKPYGNQLVNTSMNFNSDTKQLYDGNVFKSGVMVWEKNRYFNYTDGYPAYVYNGFKYQLYKANGSDLDVKDMTKPSVVLDPIAINYDGKDYYDAMPKLQVHTDGLGSNDGAYVLLFQNAYSGDLLIYDRIDDLQGFRPMVSENGNVVKYYLTDDLQEMADLNDGEPCWLATKSEYDSRGRHIAICCDSGLPVFSRDLTAGESIVDSWNFGHPQETYVPNTFTTDGDSIYDKCWRDYIRDIYNQNTRKLSCYVRLTGKPNPSMLRRWYWFDNAVWRINSIKDWNISSLDPTLVEFVKVQDTEDYALEEIKKYGNVRIVLDQYTIDADGGTINGRVVLQNPTDEWSFDEVVSVWDVNGNPVRDIDIFETPILAPLRGTGTTQFYFYVPANTGSVGLIYKFSVNGGTGEEGDTVEVTQRTQTSVASLQFVSTSTTITAAAQTVNLPFVANGIDYSSLTATMYPYNYGTVVVDGNNVRVTIEANAGVQRDFIITLRGNTLVEQTELTTTTGLKQQAPASNITVSPATLTFDFFDGSTNGQTFRITTDGGWTISSNDNN